MCWECVGRVLRAWWLLGVRMLAVGRVLGVCWACVGRMLAVGHVLGVCWEVSSIGGSSF